MVASKMKPWAKAHYPGLRVSIVSGHAAVLILAMRLLGANA